MKRSILPSDVHFQIIREKHELLHEVLVEKNINTYMIFVRETSAMKDPTIDLLVSGDVVWESAFIFLITKERLYKKIAIVGNFDADKERGKNIWDEVIPYDTGISSVLQKEINKYEIPTIAINFSLDNYMADGLTHSMFLKLQKYLPNVSFISSTLIINSIRGRKTETEIALITEAAKITEEINEGVTKQIKTGLTEIEIQKLFHDKMDELEVVESWERSSCPACDVGPDKIMGHIGPSKLKAIRGHSFHNDFGVTYSGYKSDLQRMWFFGALTELPNELRHAYDTVHEAITKAFNFIRPGVKGWEVDKVARDFVVEKGYEQFMHGLGHQVGRQAHDGGVLLGPLWEKYGKAPEGEVEENNVFTLELNVKTKNYGMVSLEEMILVTKDGAKWIVPRTENWISIQ